MAFPLISHNPGPHFKMSVNLRPCEAASIFSFTKQMLLGPVYMLVPETYGSCPSETYSLVPTCSNHVIRGSWREWKLVDLHSLSSCSHVSDLDNHKE